MSEVSRRTFFGALAAGSAALAVPVTAAPRERAALYVQPICPRCRCALAWPLDYTYTGATALGADIDTTCRCGWSGLARFTERQHV